MRKLVLFVLFAVAAVVFTACPQKGSSKADSGIAPKKDAVKVTFHIMSKCPYGVQVVDKIIPVLEKLGNDVDFNLEFIGRSNNGKFSSLHGEKEVVGDKVELCAKKHAPGKYLKMIGCMNKSYRNIPEGWEKCATEAGVDAKEIKACVDGKEGNDLLAASFANSSKAKASGSPTIYIGGKKYRGGRRENDFLRAICNAHTGNKPAVCNNIPKPKSVDLVVITDKRCKTCKYENIVGSLKGVFPGLKSRVVDYSTDEGKKLYELAKKSNMKFLPLYMFAKNVQDDPDGYKRVQRFMVQAGDYQILRAGRTSFDPTAEICDNKKDDTGNGKVDCADPTCADKLICRKEVKGKVDVFVMSHCPYGVMAMDAMKEVLDVFGKEIDFTINYIANEVTKGTFRSLHGPAEVDEDKRELCAKKHFPKNYMDYIWCRNKNIRSTDWKSCAKGPIKASVIEKCFQGDEGTKLLSENIKKANSMQIGASPTWLVNNKFKASGVTPAQVQKNICEHNPQLKGCKKKVTDKKAAPKGQCG